MKSISIEKKHQKKQPFSRVIIKFKNHLQLPYHGEDEINEFFLNNDILSWKTLLKKFPGIRITKLFTSLKPERIVELVNKAKELDISYEAPNLLTFFAIDCPKKIETDDLMAELWKNNNIECTYLESVSPVPPAIDASDDPLSANQGYLDAAPAGIDARYAWTVPGGDGGGSVEFIDIEQGWVLDHEDLPNPAIPMLSGVNYKNFGHGTAVLGIILAQDNNKGCVGITPNVKANVISQARPTFDQTNFVNNTSDAILAAIDTLKFGDVLLLETQILSSTLVFLPVESEMAIFDVIRLSTALGIVVIEPAGNGPSQNLDLFKNTFSKFVLDRSSADFKDSGAIMVGSSLSETPHAISTDSNFGNRVDCYAWGEKIVTTGGTRNNSTSTTAYNSDFNGTSGASAIIAGAAISVQSMTEASFLFRYSPRQIRAILSNPVNGTPSKTPTSDRIGVMPDLRKIRGNVLGLIPDIYIRDIVTDNGDRQTGLLFRSPDIILLSAPDATPQLTYGQGSGTENSDSLSNPFGAIKGQDNFIYVRVRNRGGNIANNVKAKIYYAESSTLVTPDLWNLIGEVNVPPVPTGNILEVSNALTWADAAIPAPGHYCFLALIGNDTDPMPVPASLFQWDDFLRFIDDNNNVAWRNFNVIAAAPLVHFGRNQYEINFISPGAPEEPIKMALEFGGNLPEKSRVSLQVPLSYMELLYNRNTDIKIDKRNEQALLPLKYSGKHAIGEIVYPASARFKMKLVVSIPENETKLNHEIYVRQLHKEKEVGRVTWLLTSKEQK